MASGCRACFIYGVWTASATAPKTGDALSAKAFSVEEYLRFLDGLPVTRADFSIQTWIGRPRAEVLPGFLARFDWLLDHADWAHRDPELYATVKAKSHEKGVSFFTPDKQQHLDPSSVFATPYALKRVLMSAIKDFDDSHSDRVIVFAGSDQLLSDAFGGNPNMWAASINLLRKYFRSIFYMAKDVHVDGVYTMPIGVLEHYLRQEAVPENAAVAIEKSRLDSKTKTKEVLLATGGYGDYRRNGTLYDNRKQSFDSRKKAKRWATRSFEAQQIGVEARFVEPRLWWTELAKYRFLLSPWGDGIQSSKTIEALLVLTIPIVVRGPFPVHDDMVRMGFPIVVIDDWTDITMANLHEWWYRLAPRLESFRRNCLSADGYWKLVTGTTYHCA